MNRDAEPLYINNLRVTNVCGEYMTAVNSVCMMLCMEIRPLDMEGFKLVTATTVVAGGGCKELRSNFCGLVMHSFHKLIASSLPLMVLIMCFVLGRCNGSRK